jgi:uncharacterized membrane protein
MLDDYGYAIMEFRRTLRKMFRSRVLLTVFIISLVWTLSLFIAPFTIPPGTVTDLDGNANRIDYAHVWDDMPLYPRAVYTLGDLQCHQKWYRTIFLNGNEMPVDARDVAIYVGLSLGLLAALFVTYTISVTGTFMNIFPCRFRNFVDRKMSRNLFLILFIVLMFLPLVIDGFTQLLTSYESTNQIRVLTGLPLGFTGGYFIGVMIGTIGEMKRVDDMMKGDALSQSPEQPSG